MHIAGLRRYVRSARRRVAISHLEPPYGASAETTTARLIREGTRQPARRSAALRRPVRVKPQRHPGQHLRRHRQVRHHRRSPDHRSQGNRLQGARGGPAGRYQASTAPAGCSRKPTSKPSAHAWQANGGGRAGRRSRAGRVKRDLPLRSVVLLRCGCIKSIPGESGQSAIRPVTHGAFERL